MKKYSSKKAKKPTVHTQGKLAYRTPSRFIHRQRQKRAKIKFNSGQTRLTK